VSAAAFEVEVVPPSPFRLPVHGGEDGVMRVRGGVASRLLHVEESPVLVRAWQPGSRRVLLRAEPVDPAAVSPPRSLPVPSPRPAGPGDLRTAVERMRFALGVDDDLGEFYRRFRRDPLLGPLLRRRPHLRPRRRPWPGEALAWAVRDVPPAATIAGRAPAEIEQLGLSAGRSLALRAVAGQIAAGRCDPFDPAADRRLLAVREIGPWTVQCLGLFGRGDPDSLPAGDLMFIKLVGRLAGLGRRATVEEVEEFYAPYAPFRGLAAHWTIGLYR
jgi:3-methyladenine DNA glycosylase/8-oxoguanine DNA glycosylase